MRRYLAGAFVVAALATAGGAAAAGALSLTDPAPGDGPTITIVTGTPTVGSSTSPTAATGAADVAKRFAGLHQHGLVLGSPHARVTLIAFVDLQCPICQAFEKRDVDPLVAKFVRAGKLKIWMRPWNIIDANDGGYDSLRGQKTVIAAAGQNKAFDFAELLYDNQGVEGSGWMDDTMISSIAASNDGLKPYDLGTSANSGATQRTINSIDRWARRHMNFKTGEMTGTPTLYLKSGRRKPVYFGVGLPNLRKLEAAIKAQLKN